MRDARGAMENTESFAILRDQKKLRCTALTHVIIVVFNWHFIHLYETHARAYFNEIWLQGNLKKKMSITDEESTLTNLKGR